MQENINNIPTTNDPNSIDTDSIEQISESSLYQLWHTELFTLNDTTVQVSQIVIALGVLLFGILCSKWIAARVGNRVLPRMKVDRGASSAIQSILYYCLLTAALLVSLQIAGVPLTALTFFGGAIALGIGFGSQNVINNFISGLILLIERPIRVGDLITINDQIGVVLEIGTRATKVESYLGSTYIVPNSILLENSVTNWNMPDASVKTTIAVGVAYGSDINQVRELLEESIKDHPTLVDSNENQIMFTSFGDSSLDFEIHCRIKPRTTQEKIAFESDTRFKINELFTEHNIEIPFPQRDFNFNTEQPISVAVKG